MSERIPTRAIAHDERSRRWFTASSLFAVLLLAVLVAGCRGRQASQPPSPPPVETAPTRIGVVDLDTVARAHPRWSELDALTKKIQQVETAVVAAPLPPPPPAPDLRPALEAEAARVRAEFEEELQSTRADRRRELEAYAVSVREQQRAKFEALRKQLEEENRQDVEAKRTELGNELKKAELQIMEEYRYPVLNLRLRAEVAGLSSEQEGREVLAQIRALQEEREERLRAKGAEFAKAFEEFLKTKTDEINARLKAAQQTLVQEAQEQLVAREAQVDADLRVLAAQRETEFRSRVEARRRALLRAAEAQLRRRQGTFLNDLSSRTQQLRAELAALLEQRARLEESILAEVKIEVATIAQAEKLDVVLTRLLSNAGGTDITAKVVQKLKR